MTVLASIAVLGTLGFVFAALLACAANYFRVEEDPNVVRVLDLLPGANCGACGAAGCHDYAVKIASGELDVSLCTVGGEEVAKKIAAIMGVEGHEVHKKVAAVHCGASDRTRKKRAEYSGIRSCIGAAMVDSGGLACRYGCLGYGDCFNACRFGAITMKDGLPYFDPEKCTACGKCVAACPKGIISLRPYAFNVVVACSSRDRGGEVRKYCPVGCIGCMICEKQVPEVFKVKDNLAVIDYSKSGIDCVPAIEKCPTKCILKNNLIK